MSEAQNLCDKVAFLNDGMPIEVGSPNELIKKYNDEKKFSSNIAMERL